jgi:hypothetical protein
MVYSIAPSSSDDEAIRVPFPFLIRTSPAPVIGHHTKEYSSIAPYDPLMQRFSKQITMVPNSFSSGSNAVLLENRDVLHEYNKIEVATGASSIDRMKDQQWQQKQEASDKTVEKLQTLFLTDTVPSLDTFRDDADENGNKSLLYKQQQQKCIMNTNFFESDYPDPPNLSKHRRSHSLNGIPVSNSVSILALRKKLPSPSYGANTSSTSKSLKMGESSLLGKPKSIHTRSRSSPLRHLPWNRQCKRLSPPSSPHSPPQIVPTMIQSKQ